MPHRRSVTATMLMPLTVLVAGAPGQQLLEVDGIELSREVQLLRSGDGTGNVLRTYTRDDTLAENHGALMDIGRLDFSVRNGSRRWLDYLIECLVTWPHQSAPHMLYLHVGGASPPRVIGIPWFAFRAAT